MRYSAALAVTLLCAFSATAQSNSPVLISQNTSTRAIAFDAPSFKAEPFSINSPIPWSVDQRARVMLFTQNLALAPGEDLSAVTASAEDGERRLYSLKVEYLGPLPGQEWMSAIILRLDDGLTDVGDVLVRVTYRDVGSNRVRIGIGHVGGGPPDDPGAAPTPARPHIISGRVTAKGVGLSDVLLTLSGIQNGTAKTDSNGVYSFRIGLGSFVVTPSSPFHNFSPQAITLDFLTGNETDANFIASRITYTISGQVRDPDSSSLANFPVTLAGNWATQTVVTNAQGVYSFSPVEAGYDYTINSASDIFTFSPQEIQGLSSNVQFNLHAMRRRYTVSGQLTDVDSSILANFPVTLTGNSTTQTVTTNYQGAFIFPNVEAGHDYGLVPSSDNVFAFAQSINNLSSDLQFYIQPRRRSFTISGLVREGIKPVGGATVSLNGWTSLTTSTDPSGFYQFPGLQAGRNYTVTVARTYFNFDPQYRSVESLQNDQQFEFQGTPSYLLSGSVRDGAGRGIGGAIVTLSGQESAVFQTAADGSFSFTVHSTGDYTLSPSIDQNYFLFSPAIQDLTAVNSDRTANFVGSLSLATDPAYVLEFDGTPKSVDCGLFWPADRPLGNFFWEVWGQPGPNAGATYMISDGYGGAHALLFGFGLYNRHDTNRYDIFGDFWNGTEIVYFGGDDGPAIGEWGHLSVGWDGRQIITYFNGVPVGRVPYSGQRWSISWRGGGGKLLLGGSDHNNLDGRIAQVRGYEETNPREATSVTAAFAPETVFSSGGQYLGNFFRPSPMIADLSNYYQGEAHRGLVRGTLPPYGVPFGCPACPLPQFVIDPTAPKFLEALPVNHSAPVALPSSAPPGALIFDSFSRANSTYTLGLGGLGSTESGSTGPQQWRTIQNDGLEPFGILSGNAVVLANGVSVAWVPVGSLTGNVDVRVERKPREWGSGLDTGIAFRVRDAQHFFFAYTSGDEDAPANSRKLTVGYYLNGIRTDLVTDFGISGEWVQLQVVSNLNGQITVSTNEGPVYSISSPILADVTGAGLYNSGPGRGLLNRWDKFSVYEAP